MLLFKGDVLYKGIYHRSLKVKGVIQSIECKKDTTEVKLTDSTVVYLKSGTFVVVESKRCQ